MTIKSDLFPLPFTTKYQKKAQQIVKTLWKNKQSFLENIGEKWLNQEIPEEGTVPFIQIYRGIISEGKEEYIYVIVNDLDKYSFHENNQKIKYRNDDEKEFMGISIIAIMEIYQSSYHTISELHRNIVEIHKSNLDVTEQKYFIKRAIDDIDVYINGHIDKLTFMYPTEIINSLNDLHLYHEWIDKSDSFIIQLALEAYQEISYYHEWLDKHKIEEKRFREKISKITTDREELRTLTNAQPPFKNKIPQHPQDILHGLASNYWDYYGRNKKLNDDGIQAIVKIISEYKRMPKKSKTKQEEEYFIDMRMMVIDKMKENNATQSEISDYMFKSDLTEDMRNFLLKNIKNMVDEWIPIYRKPMNKRLSDKEIEHNLLKSLTLIKH